ncbi:hypothetical protein F4801DRAFT_527361 [Xylaria longipes]|nr:hypothetical protein F4801DRAFT_527361 [Xylaria longipes]
MWFMKPLRYLSWMLLLLHSLYLNRPDRKFIVAVLDGCFVIRHARAYLTVPDVHESWLAHRGGWAVGWGQGRQAGARVL